MLSSNKSFSSALNFDQLLFLENSLVFKIFKLNLINTLPAVGELSGPPNPVNCTRSGEIFCCQICLSIKVGAILFSLPCFFFFSPLATLRGGLEPSSNFLKVRPQIHRVLSYFCQHGIRTMALKALIRHLGLGPLELQLGQFSE